MGNDLWEVTVPDDDRLGEVKRFVLSEKEAIKQLCDLGAEGHIAVAKARELYII